jgi:hypothetical protein
MYIGFVTGKSLWGGPLQLPPLVDSQTLADMHNTCCLWCITAWYRYVYDNTNK